MNARDDTYKIELDLDRDRIKTVLTEAYNICEEYLETSFNITREQFVSRVDIYLDSNRVSIPVFIELPSKNYSTLKIEVDLRRQKVFARMFPKSKQATLNHFLKAL